MKNSNKIWADKAKLNFANSLTGIRDADLMMSFLGDIMTQKEITEISARLEAAKMLTRGENYNLITDKTKLSSRTVARISKWLKNGYGGYEKVIAMDESHIKPARAD